ncbi:tetratricopeptide repeat protein [Sphaerotilus microaerophilus]|nr:hypothetical protein [Sphaerotilus sp. FB-5]
MSHRARHHLPRWLAPGLLGVAGVVLLGCAGQRPSASGSPAAPRPSATGPAAVPMDADTAWRIRQRERARRLEDSGDWPQALRLWDALALLPPGDEAARREHHRLAGRMAEAASDHWQRASAALKRNDLDSAEHHLVKLMALDPGHAEALQALRRIDLQRQRRPNPSTPPSPATMPPSAPRGGP